MSGRWGWFERVLLEFLPGPSTPWRWCGWRVVNENRTVVFNVMTVKGDERSDYSFTRCDGV